MKESDMRKRLLQRVPAFAFGAAIFVAFLIAPACSVETEPSPVVAVAPAPAPAPAAAPAATDRTVLPIPEPSLPPITELDVRNATAPPRFEVKAPEGAPNVLIVLIDDMGFGIPSAFGGPVSMPTAERLATKVCATTRSTIPRSARRRAWRC